MLSVSPFDLNPSSVYFASTTFLTLFLAGQVLVSTSYLKMYNIFSKMQMISAMMMMTHFVFAGTFHFLKACGDGEFHFLFSSTAF
jgi:hypothetical protein